MRQQTVAFEFLRLCVMKIKRFRGEGPSGSGGRGRKVPESCRLRLKRRRHRDFSLHGTFLAFLNSELVMTVR